MFRHTHVALLVEAGVPIKVISERLGHSNINVTLEVYTHVTKNMRNDLREKLDKFSPFFPLLKKSTVPSTYNTGIVDIFCYYLL